MTADWEQALEAAEVLLDAAASVSRDLTDATPNDTTLSEIARLHMLLHEAGVHIVQVSSILNGWAALMMEGDTMTIPGVGLLERSWSKSRTEWESEALQREVIRTIKATTEPDAVIPETGERVHSWDQIARPLTDAYYLSGSNARIKWLLAHRIAPSEYCHESPWRAKVKMTKEHSDDSTED